MKIGLIAMSGVRVATPELAELGVTLPQFVRRGEVIASLPSLGLLTVAGLTPPGHEIHYREVPELGEGEDPEDFDLVGISSFTAQIDEAYTLADRYREAGVPVVLGGIHVSLLPEEASAHADALVLSGAEGAWPRVVEDAERGCLKLRYEGLRDRVFEEPWYAPPRFDLCGGRHYNRLTVQTSRGCPLNCEFCAASLRITSRFQQKPVERAVAEIRKALEVTEDPFFELADDNSFVDKRWARDFLRALRPLGIRWFTETDVSVAEDEELLDLLHESGCQQVLIGFESPQGETLGGLDPSGWKKKRAPSYLEAIEKLQARGVTVNGCFILGLDGQGPGIFEEIAAFIERSDLLEAQLTVQTPFPGTPLYARLKREGRLLRERFWERCTLFDVNFRPAHMSVAELEEGMRWLFREVYNEEALNRRRRHYMELVKDLPS